MPAILKHNLAFVAACCLLLWQPGNRALADTQREVPFDYDSAGFTYSVAGIRQGQADIDGGGNYSTSSLLLRLSVLKPVTRGTLIGFGINLDNTRYDFSELAAFGGQTPWDTVRNINFSLPIITSLENNWAFMVAPSIGLFKETGASSSDALSYGAIFAASYRFENRSRVGIGVGAYNRLDETKLFPFLSIKLQLTDRLRVGNALRTGPTGPAGLELAYKFDYHWEAAIGRAFRSYRFRLDDEGIAPGGIGTQRGQMFFVRLSNQLQPKLRLDILAGAVFDGDLIIENSSDTVLAAPDYDTAPLLAVNLNGRF